MWDPFSSAHVIGYLVAAIGLGLLVLAVMDIVDRGWVGDECGITWLIFQLGLVVGVQAALLLLP